MAALVHIHEETKRPRKGARGLMKAKRVTSKLEMQKIIGKELRSENRYKYILKQHGTFALGFEDYKN